MLMRHDVEASLTHLARVESGRVLAVVARRFGDVDLADEAVQEALVEAARTWPTNGVPVNAPGWLMRVTQRKAIDLVRKRSSANRRAVQAAVVFDREAPTNLTDRREDDDPMLDDAPSEVDDDHLRLILLCCHPALDADTQVALTLRLVGGLTTTEIAAAFVVPEATLAQRIVRAKRKIRDAGIPLTIPSSLGPRVGALLTTLYLIFNEGYLTRSDRPGVVRVDLVDEAIRLTEQARSLLPDEAEIAGLLALELFHRSRFATRTDGEGAIVLLENQDRSRWDLATINQANRLLSEAMARMTPGPFQLQAVIAGHHANARTATDTDWTAIAACYRQLTQMSPSPIVALNHAVAVAMADGPLAGLALLEQLDGLDRYHLFHAARAELFTRAGEVERAVESFTTARSLTQNPAEQAHLDRRRAAAVAATR